MGANHMALAEKFATGATKGKASNMFIEDDTIYSYGKHFPIAKRLSHNEYLVNSDSYSVSTAKHQSRVWSALSGKITWDCPNCGVNNIPDYIKEKSIETFNRIQTANSNISHYIDRLKSYENYWIKCKIRFKFKNSKIDKMFKSFVFSDKVKAKIAKYALLDKFLLAIENNNIEEVTDCITADVNVNAKGGLALDKSIRKTIDITKLLLDNGAKITNSAMDIALRLDLPAATELLLSNGGEVTATQLGNAVWHNYPRMVALLLKYGAVINDYTQFNYIKENIELTNEIKGKLLEFELANG